MMAIIRPVFRAFLLLTIFTFSYNAASYDDTKVYIVYMGDLPKGEIHASAIHSSMLQSAVGIYKRSFHGFAARLTEQEKDMIASMDGVVNVFPSGRKQLQTTRSWDFIGFPQTVATSTIESDVIIGVLDTGIWPESKSFQDDGYGPPPAKFKGICQTAGGNFTCNNKIIGAKYYRGESNFTQDDILSPRDTDGHGTHTSSTAAGRQVSQASLFNLAKGTARGGVPSARIAVYKVCWSDDCFDADILAAFDDAIADGVDIINVSLGGDVAQYFTNVLSIGSFHAMKNGILCAMGSGNGGPDPGPVLNNAPWQLTVAATSVDRKFVTKVKLGNHKVIQGVAINTFNLHQKSHPLVFGGEVPSFAGNTTLDDSRGCQPNSLDSSKVMGKIVLCNKLITGEVLSQAKAIGTIMTDTSWSEDTAFTFPLPATYVVAEDWIAISRYISSTSKPKATIYKSTEGKDEYAPYVASFSSRGPNINTPDILKPDLSAPGVDILAAWTEATTVTGLYGDKRVASYNIVSGTSMSCPHAAGAAAYVKSFHTTWSPTAIKSSLMTTARHVNANNNTDAEFGYGSGQLDLVKATDPGLVYDASPSDYISFLCGQHIGTKNLRLITGDNTTCSDLTKGKVWDLNYPSFALSSNNFKPIVRVFHRTVTNVGSTTSTYNAIVVVHSSNSSSSLKIKVEPQVLRFESIGQTLSFTVKVRAKIEETIISGSLIWDDGVHQVRSPIVAHSYA